MSQHEHNRWGYLAPPLFYSAIAQNLSRSPVILVKLQIKNLGWIDAQYGSEAVEETVDLVRNSLRAIPHAVILGGISPSLYGVLITGKVDAGPIAEDFKNLIGQINHQFARRFLIEIAVGIVQADPTVSKDEKYWITLANLALAESARSLKPEIYSSEMLLREQVRNVIGRWTDRQAAPAGMYWVYQPVVDSFSRETVGFEALIRWNLEGIGLIPPDTFIPIAESMGVIHLIDSWTITAVVEAAAKNGKLRNQTVGINISGRTLSESPGFADFVLKTLKKRKVPAENLIVELTETAIINDLDRVKQQFLALAEGGVRLSIDDFGKGVTNLFTIASLPVAFIKLDHSLLHFDDDGLADSMLDIAASLGKSIGAKVLAEGVETEADLARVQAAGIPLSQGWLFGRPEKLEM